MDNRLFSALTTNDVLTENGMPTHSTSNSPVLDLFFRMGGSRQMSENALTADFSKAFASDPLLATKAMFYNRDVRGGQGERRSFRVFLKWLAQNHPEVVRKNLHLIPEYGRWDDVFVVFGTSLEENAIRLIKSALLENSNGLCAKWMPREGKAGYAEYGNKIRKYLDLRPREYRKLLSRLTKVVENQMCADAWNEIKYEQVPSIASNKYRTAFYRHDEDRYSKFVEKAIKGEVKVHADAIFPHDIVKKILNGIGWMGYGKGLSQTEKNSIQAQWMNLPDYVGEGSFIPVCDVSGSMNGLPMEVSISLGIYLSERNKGTFKDGFITFSRRPQLQILKGSLFDKVSQLSIAHWEMNTNLEAVFNLIVDSAVRDGLSQDELPENILILSDMQFDQCIHAPSENAMSMIERKYKSAGYKVPNVVFWNLRTSSGIPVKMHQSGTALVSGFSPSIMKNLLAGEMNPVTVMLSTLNSERYSKVTV